ncbi:hypothetical protein L798_10294 [Zootermopsis nevadensis]|uniref:Uncharacterized protein n=1 Tax=Zootermopsis nevadensis TaxID=136037 RepID=A0A067QZA3_ZOONE|nr:hypothetical protein L798_10294 [Zootermopsis nevadensis]
MTPPFFTLPSATKVAPLSLVSIHSVIPCGRTNYTKLTPNMLVMTFAADFFLVIIKAILTEVAVGVNHRILHVFVRLRDRPPAIVHEKINTRPCHRLSEDTFLKQSWL